MVGIRGGARRVAYVRGEGGDPLTSLLLSISPRLVISGPIDISRPPWSSLLVKQYGQAHPAERGHFKVGGEGGNYDIDSHANIEDRCNDILYTPRK